MTQQRQPCHICSSTRLRESMLISGYQMTECLDCKHIQVNPCPSDEELLAQYQHEDDDSFYGNSCSVSLLEQSKTDRTFLRKYYSERLEVIKTYVTDTSSNILDFGCTNGIFTQSILDSGYANAFGYDVAELLVEQGRQQGLQLFSGPLNEFAKHYPSFFDFIVSYHVFEHLPRPKDTLRELRGLMKSNALLYVNVPHIHSLQAKILREKCAIIDPPHHIHYFTCKSLRRIFEDEEFEVIAMETPFWEKTTDTFLELNGFNKNTAVFLRYAVSPMRWLIKWLALGGTVALVARKR